MLVLAGFKIKLKEVFKRKRSAASFFPVVVKQSRVAKPGEATLQIVFKHNKKGRYDG